ncbi:MAG: hypothetical protein E7273_15150 [Pseudobutyrivibrio ruminis]|nr:hypothetical protein [Pseudobutyrivibrio ruminis]
MNTVYLTYNPYTKEKTLSIDGEEKNQEQTCSLCGPVGSELSEWCNNFYEKIFNFCNIPRSLRDFSFKAWLVHDLPQK